MSDLVLQNQLSLLEIAKRTEPDGNFAVIAEVLNKTNAILKDVPFVEANGAYYHKIVKRNSVPTGEWRKLNAGVSTAASDTTEVAEPIGMLESFSEIDEALLKLAADPTKARMSEAAAFIEGLGQTFATTLFYGNANIDAEKFTGLAARQGTLNSKTIVGCSGTGSDTSSIYVVAWGENEVFGVYPKGHKSAGIEHNAIGTETKTLSTGKVYRVVRDQFKMYGGLAVKDDRCIGRVANIETAGSSNLFDDDALITVLNHMSLRGNRVIYVNPTIKTQMDINLKDKTNVNYSVTDAYGPASLVFRGVPVKVCEAIVNTETAIS